MVPHQNDDDEVDYVDSIDKHSYDEFQDTFNDLNDEYLKLSKLCDKKKISRTLKLITIK